MDELGSQESVCPEVPLSQDTLNTLMNSLGGHGAVGSMTGLIGDDFERFQTGELADEAPFPTTDGPENTELQVSRTIIHTTSPPVMPQWGSSQPSQVFPQYPPVTTNGNGYHHTSPPPTLITVQPSSSYQNGLADFESPVTTTSTTTLTPPPSTSYNPPPLTSLTMPQGNAGPSKPTIRSTLPFPGDYGFQLYFEPDNGKKISKSANFTYSKLANRVYLKPKYAATFSFCFQRPPPPDSVIRATPIFNAPEFIGDLVACCLVDTHAQKEAGKLFPSHFIRPQEKDKTTSFYGDGINQPSSIVTPLSVLQQKSEDTWSMVYLFPCVTSHMGPEKIRSTHVQVMFTLEYCSIVIGRCVIPIRVCTSPGRDRIIDEEKINKAKCDNEDDVSMETTSSRKRSRSSPTEVVQCTLPPKRHCVRLSGEMVEFNRIIPKEFVPYVDVCIRMMVQVHNVPVPVEEDIPSPQVTFPSVEAWLKHNDLGRYSKMLQKNGITQLYQVPGITEENLKSWGMRTIAHRKKFLQEKDKVIDHDTTLKSEEDEDLLTPPSVERDGVDSSPTLFTSQSPPNPAPSTAHPPYFTRQASRQTSQGSQSFSQGSQLSSGSTQPFRQAFEVVQIQLRKKLSGSSTSSSSQQ